MKTHSKSSLRGVSLSGRISVLLGLAVILITSVAHFGDSVPTVQASEAEIPVPTFERIDAHAHALGASQALYDMLKRLNMGLITIAVVDKHDFPIYKEEEPQQQLALEAAGKSEGRIFWISTFDPQNWEQPGFADRVIKHLDQTFNDGAVGVKIYKNIGMELKSRKGKYLLPDDPVFDPILDHIAGKGKTLYAHIAEPKQAWEPSGPDNPYSQSKDYSYNLYGRTDDPPSKQVVLAARDHLLEKHPNLRVVGCHLGSMEDDVDEIAKRLDRYPNFVVDTGARVDELMLQPRGKVRAFLIKYQDRVLYGVDEQLNPWNDKTSERREEHLKQWEARYENDWKYFASTQIVKFESWAYTNKDKKNLKVQGLGLPESVLRKIFHDNAMRWVIDHTPFGSVVAPKTTEAETPKPTFERIDAHAHAFLASPLLYDMLKRLNMGLITIAVVDKHDYPIYKEEEPQQQLAREVARKSDGRVAWISTFDPQNWEQPGFADRVIQHLDQTFKDGAVGVKIYKSIGMELKSKDGKWLMPDDPVFDPILDHIAARGKTLYAHIADPKEAWEPPGPNNIYSYNQSNDYAYNLYGRPDHPPSKEQILAARDHLLEKHPNLRVVGCHLGSMADSLDEIAKRFDRYPNFVVDTGAFVDDLMLQPRGKVRAFLIKYQDRVLYGVDEVLDPGNDKTSKEQEQHLKIWEAYYETDWKHFATTETVKLMNMAGWPSRENLRVQGLGLPESVLRKIFHDNAMRWVIDPQP